ncbi:J domain-containing protein [Pseudomonas typographi]|uniref:J domain-containing protein n=1 Tax=Pseudomonas typographi TaxID=2715964 RepID=A0ABR7Z0T6_9PSED|nr:J domain-containing protein [Pseudomonas typographi]MBD1553392.1 J domain-containing protein [Pseudomonas typographi]MBD1588736.1 J domain-containing protein [Pseudomonas typographi]MBD1599075.1 J domain-containing protein [Pseudomonas typographi]
MRDVHTHYDNLKITPNAPPEVIRAAYKALVQKYHPDKHPGNESAAKVLRLVNEAYAVLSDPREKARHDAWIRAQPGRRAPLPKPAAPQPVAAQHRTGWVWIVILLVLAFALGVVLAMELPAGLRPPR